jgi:hypothetical protein
MDRRSSLSREEKVERGREDDRRTLKRGSTRLARRDEGIGDRGCVCAPNNTREDEGWGKKLGMGLAIYSSGRGREREGAVGKEPPVLCCAAGAVTVSCRVRGARRRNGLGNRHGDGGGGGAELSRGGHRDADAVAAPRCERLSAVTSASLGSALVVRWLVSVRLADAVKRAH